MILITIKISVGQIVEWYHPKSSLFKRINSSTFKKPNYKFGKKYLRKNYKSSFRYTFARCRGILIHESIEIFITNHLPNLPLYFGDNISYYKLWYYLNREFYRGILEVFIQNEEELPQIKEWRGELLYYCMKAAKVLIRRILRLTVKRLEKNHKLENIFDDITPLLQERSMKIKYNGIIIFFKPDWIDYELNRAIITDFKSGEYNKHLSMKHAFQVLLFAFCFSKYQKIPVEQCEIYYLKHNKREIINFNEPMKKLAKYMVNEYIKHHYPQIYSQNRVTSKNLSELIPRRSKLEDYTY